eukprot:TRINITY_DN3811_c1_g1_i1.p2 TRINITY_DN3811_c1_g1~~TRINITY_DN3811_c1_g1_i1.p2  ORF type:complete len:336 (-),score=1.49 TRINITY_DN3811_c1_g1_i1:1321-2328(-)
MQLSYAVANVARDMFLLAHVMLYMVYVSYGQDCSCGSSFKHTSNPFHVDIPKVLRHELCQSDTFCTEGEIEDYKPYIYLINGSEPGQTFIVCTTPKSGGSRMKHLFYGIAWKDYHRNYEDQFKLDRQQNWDSSRFINFENYDKLELQNILNDPNIPRFAFVRNPYVRAISMFNDKVKRKATAIKHGYPRNRDRSFPSFVNFLYDRLFFEKRGLNRHFPEQSEHCLVNMGMTYNYILKIEEMEEWYDCFVEKVNIREIVLHGWPKKDMCYLSTPKFPCNGPYFQNGVLITPGGEKSVHQTSSSNYLEEYYSDKEIAKKVARIFQQDFINFNYSFIL